jgi:hypothetical protein
VQLGITPERIEPGHPEQNGRHERMHRTLAEEATRPPPGICVLSRGRSTCFVCSTTSSVPTKPSDRSRSRRSTRSRGAPCRPRWRAPSTAPTKSFDWSTAPGESVGTPAAWPSATSWSDNPSELAALPTVDGRFATARSFWVSWTSDAKSHGSSRESSADL